MNKFYKEPLLHFVLIGAVFFLLYSWIGKPDDSKDTIVLDNQDLEEIVSKFEMQWNRIPTEEELIQIVSSKVEDEVFYKEALKMNLDSNDEIIKRRLSQKMKSLTKDVSSIIEPSKDELVSYYEKHKNKYSIEATYSFYQIFFSPDKRDNFRLEAKHAIYKANSRTLDEAMLLGDPISLPKKFTNTSSFHIRRQMGAEFANSINELELNNWQGPISSGFGSHLVYITSKKAEEIAPYSKVKKQVLEDFMFEKQQKTKQGILKEFIKKYDIKYDVNDPKFPAEFIEKLKSKIQ